MLTRKQYMNKECTHDEYYGQFAPLIIPVVVNWVGAKAVRRSTDPHFNDIPLLHWDVLHGIVANRVGLLLRESGGVNSQAETVCVAKAAAKLIRDHSDTHLAAIQAIWREEHKQVKS